MRFVSLIFTLLLFLVALGLALSNTQSTDLRFFATGEEPLVTLPLVILLLGFFLIGVAFGMLTGLPSYLRQQAELIKLRRQLKKFNDGSGGAPGSSAPAAPVIPRSDSSKSEPARLEG